MQNKYIKFIIAILIPQFAGVIGSIFTSEKIPTWYSSLEKSSLNPPGWVFGPVWITLYALMGIALFLVWSKPTAEKNIKPAITVFGVQLAVNTFWSIAFFGMENPLLALIVILALWVLIIVNIILFYRISKPAGLLLIPYLLWVTFATYLNYSVLILN